MFRNLKIEKFVKRMLNALFLRPLDYYFSDEKERLTDNKVRLTLILLKCLPQILPKKMNLEWDYLFQVILLL